MVSAGVLGKVQVKGMKIEVPGSTAPSVPPSPTCKMQEPGCLAALAAAIEWGGGEDYLVSNM